MENPLSYLGIAVSYMLYFVGIMMLGAGGLPAGALFLAGFLSAGAALVARLWGGPRACEGEPLCLAALLAVLVNGTFLVFFAALTPSP